MQARRNCKMARIGFERQTTSFASKICSLMGTAKALGRTTQVLMFCGKQTPRLGTRCDYVWSFLPYHGDYNRRSAPVAHHSNTASLLLERGVCISLQRYAVDLHHRQPKPRVSSRLTRVERRSSTPDTHHKAVLEPGQSLASTTELHFETLLSISRPWSSSNL
jgi:hypothetical protein